MCSWQQGLRCWRKIWFGLGDVSRPCLRFEILKKTMIMKILRYFFFFLLKTTKGVHSYQREGWGNSLETVWHRRSPSLRENVVTASAAVTVSGNLKQSKTLKLPLQRFHRSLKYVKLVPYWKHNRNNQVCLGRYNSKRVKQTIKWFEKT